MPTPYPLRDYQQQAVDATIDYFRSHQTPAVIVLPTGAGKSLVIAELASLARGKVLVLAHVKELVEQNHQKYLNYGLSAGIFSAGLKRKESGHKVTFASVQSVAPNIDLFNSPISLLIIDECHRVSDDEDGQYQKVIKHLSTQNPKLKVLGLTATPYRLSSGWIYQNHHRGIARSDSDKPFRDCIFELPLRQMIDRGFLTPPKMVDATIAHYDFSTLNQDSFGRYKGSEVNQLLQRHKRVTESIIEQVVQLSEDRQGVMVFAATVQHAEEIAGYLPSEQCALITGKTCAAERERLIDLFKAKQIKYLVNVSVLTTGFDAPHVDFIALLRPTESVSLYQQIIGRGLRLAPGKTDCLVVDYTGCQFNLHHPEVGEPKPNADSQPVQVFCPECEFANIFWGKVNSDGLLEEHYGRRCQALLENGERCSYRFKFKLCSQCDGQNDIAARQCSHCQALLVDPDEQLRKALQLKDAKVIRCAGMTFEAKQQRLLIRYHDESGETLSEQFDLQSPGQRQRFNQLFSRRRDGSVGSVANLAQALELESALLAPDFVIARKAKHYWQVKERVFDYKGNFRKANQL